MNEQASVCQLPLHVASKLIRERTISPLELAEATFSEIDRVDPTLNSFISVPREAAMQHARALTERISSSGELGLLHGIPISLKDNIDSGGVLTTSGSPLFATRVPERDAAAWRRLVDAGAVLAGKNNLWELAFGGPHPDFGTTWNPWDTARTCGGTSSGSAAAVAAGLSFASLGTDTGGSARVPASLCGLVSLKPTFGLVPRDGVLPVSYTMDHVCPITREVRDAALVLAALSGHPEHDLESGLAGVKIGVAIGDAAGPINDEVRICLEAAYAIFQSEGAFLSEVELPNLDTAGTTARVIMDSEAADHHRSNLRTKPELIGRVARNRLETAEFLPASYYVRAQRVRRVITDAVESILDQVDAVVLPAVGVTAFEVTAEGFETKSQHESPLRLLGRFTPLANATGHPALVVPCGSDSEGLPVSLQLIGRFGSDFDLLAIARAYERSTEWHTRRPALAA